MKRLSGEVRRELVCESPADATGPGILLLFPAMGSLRGRFRYMGAMFAA